MVPKIEQMLMNSRLLHKIGSTIVKSTAKLAADIRSEAIFNGQGDTDALLHNLPACLQNDLKSYGQQQKAEFDELLQQRKQTGGLLSQASNLADFQEQVSQIADIDLYKINADYQSKHIPEYLRIPDDSKPS